MLITASIVFWSLVAYWAVKPQTVRVPVVEGRALHRSRRNGVVVPPPTSPAWTSFAMAPSPAVPVLSDRPTRPALPQGATPLPGTVVAWPLPPHAEDLS